MWVSKLVKRIYLVEKFLTHSPSLRKTVPLTFDNLLGQFPGQSKENIVYFISFSVHSLWRRANAWNISFETLDSGNLHNQLFWHVTLSHQLSTTDREILMGLLPCHCSPTNGDEKQRNHSTPQTHFCKEFGMFLRWLSAQKSWWLLQIGILPLGCLCF